jgi:hypothetical protein
MPRKGWKVQAIRSEIVDQLMKRYEKETKDLKFKPKFTAWLNQFLLEALKD